MIKGLHGLFYSPQADELRAFIRDKLGFPYTDTGGGWLIFDMAEADLGCHPSDTPYHSLSFFCDDIHKTMAELKSRGVKFTTDITEEEWGLLTHFMMPGGMQVELYEPKYEKRFIYPVTKKRLKRRPAKRKAKRTE